MENMIRIDALFSELENKDNNSRYEAFKKLLQITEQEVSWIYDYWQILVDKLNSDNSFHRSIGLMLLANLIRSDSENKFEEILDGYLGFFEDEKFITSRQCIQNVWKIAIHKEMYKSTIIDHLVKSYAHNIHSSRNGKLIKQDVISSLLRIYKHKNDPALLHQINALVSSENDPKISKVLRKMLAE